MIQRIDKDIDASLAAYTLLSSCFLRAFVEHFFSKSMQPPWNKFVDDLVAQTTHAARSGRSRQITRILRARQA